MTWKSLTGLAYGDGRNIQLQKIPLPLNSPPATVGQVDEVNYSRWFAEEVQPHEPALRAYLRARFPRLMDVDDLVQETYARLLRAHVAGRVAEMRPYLFVTARNAAFDAVRRKQLVTIDCLGDLESLRVVEDGPNAAESVSLEQEIEILHEAIANLPPRCREVLQLRRFDGLSLRQISERLGISTHTVDAHLCLAVFRCRRFLLERGVSRVRLGSVRQDPAIVVQA